MLKQTRIDEVYANKETGMSSVILQNTKEDICGIGFAHCHPEDEFSQYFGCELAEVRAEIDILKDRKEMTKDKVDAVRNFIKAMQCDKRFDNKSPTAKAMWRQWNILNKEYKQYGIEIEHRKRKIKDMCRQRDVIIKRFNAKQEALKEVVN